MTIRSNPRILLLVSIILALFAATVLGFLFLTALYGVILLAVAVFISYQFLRFAVSHIRSRLKTDEQGITFHMPSNADESFTWGEISHAGFCTPARGRQFAFVYSQERDRLITVPREYENFDHFLNELENRLEFTRFDLGPGETIQGKLRQILGLSEGPEATEEPSEEGISEEEDPEQQV